MTRAQQQPSQLRNDMIDLEAIRKRADAVQRGEFTDHATVEWWAIEDRAVLLRHIDSLPQVRVEREWIKRALEDCLQDGLLTCTMNEATDAILAIIRPKQEWQPIETAPKDRPIEYWHPKYEMTSTCVWKETDERGEYWWDDSMTEEPEFEWWRDVVRPPSPERK